MSELGDKYKQATEQVLRKYGTDKDSLGRCQKWKLATIKSDRQSDNHSGLMKQFVEDVEATVNRLESAKQVVADLCSSNSSSSSSKPSKKQHNVVAVEPIEPISPDTSSYGIDLRWD
jgi:hypothetical protein